MSRVKTDAGITAAVLPSATDTAPPCAIPSGDREGGVRIIEGSLLGHRGMEDLQGELSKWELYDNVRI